MSINDSHWVHSTLSHGQQRGDTAVRQRQGSAGWLACLHWPNSSLPLIAGQHRHCTGFSIQHSDTAGPHGKCSTLNGYHCSMTTVSRSHVTLMLNPVLTLIPAQTLVIPYSMHPLWTVNRCLLGSHFLGSVVMVLVME